MRKLKITHKALMIFEAGFIYCKRHELDYNDFDNMLESFDDKQWDELDVICKDLRFYRRVQNYKCVTVTDSEYDECVDKFGSNY